MHMYMYMHVWLYFTAQYNVVYKYLQFVSTHRESALAEMGIAVHKGETVGVFQPKKVS